AFDENQWSTNKEATRALMFILTGSSGLILPPALSQTHTAFVGS
ncbi:uncharacterized, partial [Tachysurus ichikawai]